MIGRSCMKLYWSMLTLAGIAAAAPLDGWAQAQTRGSKFPSAVTRGGAIRTERDRRAEHYTTVSDLSGIDCSGATDSTAGLQNAITGGAVLKFPLGCRIVLSNTITVRSR